MLFLLGANVVGRSHECDYPEAIVRSVPTLTGAHNKFESSAQMHEAVTVSLRSGKGLYWLDTQLLAELKPDVIVTQSLCSVCAVDLDIVRQAASAIFPPPRIVDTNPMSLEGVIADVRRLGAELGLAERGEAAAAELQARVDRAVAQARQLAAKPKKVVFLEWTCPLFPGGHWTPQMIVLAGGVCPVNPPRPGGGGAAPSRETDPAEVVSADPDLIIVAPCGLDLATTRREAAVLEDEEWWCGLRAVRSGSVVLVDGNQHFNRPGPRLVEALEWLVGLLAERPDLMPPGFPWERLTPGEQAAEEAAAREVEAEAARGRVLSTDLTAAAASVAPNNSASSNAAWANRTPPTAAAHAHGASGTGGPHALAPEAGAAVAQGRTRPLGSRLPSGQPPAPSAPGWDDSTYYNFSLPSTPRGSGTAGPVCEGVASSCARGGGADATADAAAAPATAASASRPVAEADGAAVSAHQAPGSGSRRAAESIAVKAVASATMAGDQLAASSERILAGVDGRVESRATSGSRAGEDGVVIRVVPKQSTSGADLLDGGRSGDGGGAGGEGGACGGPAAAAAPADPWVPTRSRWNVLPGLPADIEDLHAAACEETRGSYHDPQTGFLVFTAVSLLKRGSCCGNACRHCPYAHYKVTDKPRSNVLTVPALMHPKARGGPRARPPAGAAGAAGAGGGVTLLAYEGCAASDAAADRMAADAGAGSSVPQQGAALLVAFDADTGALWGGAAAEAAPATQPRRSGSGALKGAPGAPSLSTAMDASLRTGLGLVAVPLQVRGRSWHADESSARGALTYVLRSATELLTI
ncbi:hypothetical protein GPECTOR_10g930 [Gonium pectorale]|uniref:Fe/B12 periplasmic-binding domain-containing protein n=1 Tax=Gonium pectorale TaxID=33097 RepID=A0A150GRD6_GONPE|nr:hypothetical protein GPECTOR_10g930 [Gonium pectorale]|eukprot:KXZ52298.1 hypothetical protein GPECTOR_10g930 [Gonium pectorale]